MKKHTHWIIGTLTVAVIGILVFVLGKGMSKKTLEEVIKDHETEITEQIGSIISEAEKSMYSLENYSFELVDAENTRADTIFWADWRQIREVEEDPFIQGLCQAAEALTDEQEKEYAKEIIDGWIIEKQSWPEVEHLPTQIVILPEGSSGWSLYYPYVMDGKETLIPLNKMAEEHWREDPEARRQEGIDTMNDAIGWLQTQ